MTLLAVLVGVAVLVKVAMWLSPLRALPDWMQLLLSSVVVAALFAVILLPVGLAIDRALARLREYIERVGAGECTSEPPVGVRPRRGPIGWLHTSALWAERWLHPLGGAFLHALDRFRKREQEMRDRLRDMDVRHHVSEAERRQVEAVLHSLRDGVIVTDAFNEIVMANKAAAEILGFDLEEAIHTPIQQVIRDARLCQLIRDARNSANFADGRHVEHEIVSGGARRQAPGTSASCLAPDASTKFYDVMLICVENHKREVGGVVTILHDMTRERELSQLKTDFVSKASHELRTPLSAIRAYVEMLVDGEAEDEQSRREFYGIMHAETERLGRLIDNMLNISRIEAGIVQIDRENVDMKEIIQRAVHTLEASIREKSLAVSTRLAGIDLCVEGDRDMLLQVVLNLLSNAIKYTPEGGRITVSADSDNLTRSVLTTVTDTGLGVPPDAVPRLFEKFYRVENYKRVAKGTGLGLSLCKHIVETVHHGQIGVESKLGMGSRFWFSVPMHYAGAQQAAA